MGRIKTTQLKRASLELFNKHKSELKENFEENKAMVTKFIELRSKKFKNVIAGYVTRLMRREETV